MRAAADVQQFLEGLNESQRAAVVHPGGPLLVLAGAGSGKTRVLTMRISWLVQEAGLRPWEILALTFTNKAAREMKERVSRYLGPDGRDCWVSTFHSTCLRILRREIDLIDGFAGDFVIYDDRDSKELVKRLLKENRVPTTVNPRAISTAIDRAKNDALSPEELAAERRPDIDPRVPEIYRQYQARLREANAVDFGDLILHTIRLFDAHPSVLSRYRSKFNHVLIDEYQDTNHSQYRLLTQLADHGPRNVCVVGDEDQSIYSFRGADIRNILDFERDFPGAQVVRLERNYRSTKAILQAATAVVEKNEERKGKTLWTDKPGGEPISLHTSFDDREEARTAVQLVRRELSAGRKPKDIALFYRTNGQSRLVEEEFLAARLPFVLIGGQRFYERREVKDAMAWLRFLHNPKDDISLLRIINTPPRGIGAKTVDAVMSRGRETGGAWQGVVALVDDESTPKRQVKPLRAFRDLVDALQVARAGRPLPELVEAVLERSGMADHYRQDGSFEAEGRLSNLAEFVNSTTDYGEKPPGVGLAEFLDRVALVSDVDKLEDATDDDEGRITLMTVHSSKGLEYPVVLVIGMDEGLFPHARASTFQSELEEERRLAYVAITRAQEKLHLLRARRRPGQGQMRGSYAQTEPSRFLRDIPRDLLEGSLDLGRSWTPSPTSPRNRGDAYIDYDERPSRSQPLGASRFDRPAPAQRRLDLTAPDDDEPRLVVEPEEASGMLRVGTRVLHPQFGQGEIRVLDGPGDNMRATIFFRQGGNKRIYLRYANLEILSI